MDVRRAANALADLEALLSEIKLAIRFIRDRAFAEFRGDLSTPSSPVVTMDEPLGSSRPPAVAAALCASGPAVPLAVADPLQAAAAPTPRVVSHATPRILPRPLATTRGKVPRVPFRSVADQRVPTPHPEVVIDLNSESSTSSSSGEESSASSVCSDCQKDGPFSPSWVNGLFDDQA